MADNNKALESNFFWNKVFSPKVCPYWSSEKGVCSVLLCRIETKETYCCNCPHVKVCSYKCSVMKNES